MNISENAMKIINLIEDSGFEAFAVGGCVRDAIMNKPCNDVDITTSALPEQTEVILENNNIRYVETGLKHGTITAIYNNENFEITTYRTDGNYNDNRHPDSVHFVSNIKDDLSRRDFTINAMAYNDKQGIVDMFSGREDIESRTIRAVGNANLRFNEDALRIMRAIRFACVLGFELEEETKKAVFDNKQLLNNVSPERLFSELSRLLMGDNVYKILMEYRDVIAVFIPELKTIFDMPQNNKWHIYDVWEHTCKSVEAAPKDLALRFTMLLHDIGKAKCKTTDENGVDHYYGHQKISAEIASGVLKRLKASNEFSDRVLGLIAVHDAHIGTDKKKIKKWLSKIGEDSIFDLISVKRADKFAQNPQLTADEIERLSVTELLARQIIDEGEPFSLKDLQINGYDIMSLGIKGRAIGDALDYLLDKVISGEINNTKAELIDCIKKSIN